MTSLHIRRQNLARSVFEIIKFFASIRASRHRLVRNSSTCSRNFINLNMGQDVASSFKVVSGVSAETRENRLLCMLQDICAVNFMLVLSMQD